MNAKHVIMGLAVLTLAACNQPASNTAERAGEAMDTQAEQAATGQTNMGDGPMENAGEAVDQARENNAAAARGAADATTGAAHDNNPATVPTRP